MTALSSSCAAVASTARCRARGGSTLFASDSWRSDSACSAARSSAASLSADSRSTCSSLQHKTETINQPPQKKNGKKAGQKEIGKADIQAIRALEVLLERAHLPLVCLVRRIALLRKPLHPLCVLLEKIVRLREPDQPRHKRAVIRNKRPHVHRERLHVPNAVAPPSTGERGESGGLVPAL